jgi:hypothetical protein
VKKSTFLITTGLLALLSLAVLAFAQSDSELTSPAMSDKMK